MQASVPSINSTSPDGRELWLLAAITLCGLALRLAEAAGQPLWTDEALTLVLEKWTAFDLLLRPVDPTAGLYYVLHQLFVPDDAGLITIRGISIVAGTLSIPAIYAVARLGIGRNAGPLAAVLLAISPALVDYSQEARAYSLQLFLVLVSAAALLGWARQLGKKGGTGVLVVFAITTVLAFSTHLSGSFWVIPAGSLAVWAVFRRGTLEQKRVFVIALAAMAIGALPEVSRLVWRAYLGGGFVWLAQAGLGDALATWSGVLLPTQRLFGGLLAHLLVVAVVVLLAWRLYVHRARVRTWSVESPVAAGVLGILLFAPVLVWLFGFLVVPVFMPRTILIGVAGFILLICLVDRLENRRIVALSAAALFALALLSAGLIRAKEGWDTVGATVLKSAWPGDVIVHCASWKYPAFRHAVRPAAGISNIVLLDWRMVRFDDQAPAHSDWERVYFRTMLEPPMDYLLGKKVRLPIREESIAPFRRAWVVESECGADAIATTRDWLGNGRWKLAGAASPTEHHAGIKVWLFEPGRTTLRPVYAISD